jgi:hypothetical protein
MKKSLIPLILILTLNLNAQSLDVQIQDSLTLSPIAFSTVSFSNNKGLISDEDGMFELVKNELKPGEILSGLVNNAGIALGGPVNLIDTDIFRKQFDVNFFGLIDVTKAYLPLLGAYKGSKSQGKIINISSVSGRRAHPFVAPYSASKFAVEAFSDSLRREMLLYGVDVVLIEPGPIKTAIWDKAPDPENNEFTGSDYEPALKRFYKMFIEMGKKGFDADIIGDRVKEILQNPSPKTRHVITPNRFMNYTLSGILPDRAFDKLTGKGLGLLKK